MAKVFSRQKRHPFAAEQPTHQTAPPQSVTMEQWNDMKEMDPPPEAAPPQPSSPTRSNKLASNSSIDSHDEENPQDDFGLSCSGLLGEEVLLDTGFGKFARSALEATADSLRKLSKAVVQPIHKTDTPRDDNVIIVDNDALLRENERLKRENTWLQEENESLRGGTYANEEDDILSARTGNSV